MATPKPYLSFSQMVCFEMSKKTYIERYIKDERQFVNINMKYGSKMADALEKDEDTGDILLDMMMVKIPKFQIRDKPIVDKKKGFEITAHDKKKYRVPVLRSNGFNIPLLAIPDTAKMTYSAFKEYKTSVRNWTQKMADDSGQITFYATAIHLVKGFIPKDIELVNVPVEYVVTKKGKTILQPTGELIVYKTTRTMADILKMRNRIKRAWLGINKLVEEELL